MRIAFTVVLAGLLFSVPALAGTVATTNGAVVWQSTQCPAPVAPPALVAANSETPASDMNNLMTQYNMYAQQTQAYMDCLSSEAQTDANTTAQAIVQSAKVSIDQAQANLQMLGAPLKAKQ